MKIIFSHGYSAPPEKYAHIFGAWEGLGFDVLSPEHRDAHDFDPLSKPERLKKTHEVLSRPEALESRLSDILALMSAHPGEQFILAGHSFGAHAAMVASGVSAKFQGHPAIELSDERVVGFIALSRLGLEKQD